MFVDGGAAANYQRPANPRLAAARPCGALAFALLGLGIGWATPAGAEMPTSGSYSGRMCVLALEPRHAAGDCGPVDILLLSERRANVRISDIVYRLELDRGRVDVILMQGTMQIDGFTTSYEWQDQTLNFVDQEKGLRYQIHFDPTQTRRRRDQRE